VEGAEEVDDEEDGDDANTKAAGPGSIIAVRDAGDCGTKNFRRLAAGGCDGGGRACACGALEPSAVSSAAAGAVDSTTDGIGEDS